MSSPRILAISGSARAGSFNQMLVRFAAQAAEEAGADVTVVDWKDYFAKETRAIATQVVDMAGWVRSQGKS